MPAALAALFRLPDPKNDKGERPCVTWFARRVLRATSKRYGYDTSYLEMMLEESPDAFFKFAPSMKASAHREVVPVEASFAAKITGAMAEDCGPCTQLCVDMALEAGMAKDQIEAVLAPRCARDERCDERSGFRFAEAVVRRSADDEDSSRSRSRPLGRQGRDRSRPRPADGPHVPDGEGRRLATQGSAAA